MFGVQNGGWCASGPAAKQTYKKYGESSACRQGEGGPGANDVYEIGGQWERPSSLLCYLGRRTFVCQKPDCEPRGVGNQQEFGLGGSADSTKP